jgi:D-aminoacyl-tRNA deacylase
MRALLQRSLQAAVTIGGRLHASIPHGLVILVGVETLDEPSDAAWLAQKIVDMRIFSDEAGKMNLSLRQTGGDLLVVSQFTLHASTQKGNRPSYQRAARPELAVPLYQAFIHELERLLGRPVATGIFGADMQVSLTNDGPVTIWLDSRDRE